MEVPRLGVQSELQLPAKATVTLDLNCICSRQHQILNPLSEASNRTRVLVDTSRICFQSHNGNSLESSLWRMFVEGARCLRTPQPAQILEPESVTAWTCPVSPRGSGSKPPSDINTHLPTFPLSHVRRGFLETLEKEALQDWMETP